MKSKNNYWITAGILNLVTFFLHLIGGQMDLVKPMLESPLSTEVNSQLVGAWHMVTIILIATTYILLMAGFKRKYSSNLELISFVGFLNLIFCLPFVVSGFYYGLLVPQWIFFSPIAIFTIIGIKKEKINA